jgi:hypothetical protein
MDIIIEQIDLDDVLINDKKKYNSNNHDSDMPLDEYRNILSKTYAPYWIDAFKNNYIVLNIDIPNWFHDAHQIGQQTGTFSKLFQDELDSYVSKYKSYDEILKKGYFIRTNKVSLKFGQHGCGPYYNIKQIVESLLSSRKGHSCIDINMKKLKLYLIDWMTIDINTEFRIFVCNNQITAISQQNIYETNKLLCDLNNEDRTNLINKWTNTIIEYFNKYIKTNIIHITSYTIDLALIDDIPYFIELNSFGKEMAAGSAGFHWIIDEDKLYNNQNKIYFRYII